MVNVIIKHEWTPENEAKAFEAVQGILKMAEENKLPQGFRLLSVYVDAPSHTVFCVYEAPSKQAFQQLVSQVKPPTKYTIYEVNKLY